MNHRKELEVSSHLLNYWQHDYSLTTELQRKRAMTASVVMSSLLFPATDWTWPEWDAAIVIEDCNFNLIFQARDVTRTMTRSKQLKEYYGVVQLFVSIAPPSRPFTVHADAHCVH